VDLKRIVQVFLMRLLGNFFMLILMRQIFLYIVHGNEGTSVWQR
jgi:hypothetical protein